jgi:hypothetical protein
VPSEALLEAGQDRSCGSNGELLAGHLEDECPEGVEAGQVIDPSPRAEVGVAVDHLGEDWIGAAEGVAGDRIGGWGGRHVPSLTDGRARLPALCR